MHSCLSQWKVCCTKLINNVCISMKMKNNWTYTALPEDPDNNPEWKEGPTYAENIMDLWIKHITVLGTFLFLLFNNDKSNFMTKGCVTNLFVDDTMIYASGDSVGELKLKLQNCLNDISSWHRDCLYIITICKNWSSALDGWCHD